MKNHLSANLQGPSLYQRGLHSVADFDSGHKRVNQVLRDYRVDYAAALSRAFVFTDANQAVKAYIITCPEEKTPSRIVQEINSLGVDRSVQRENLGRQLIAAALENCCLEYSDRKKDLSSLHVVSYPKAVPFYAKLGFSMTDLFESSLFYMGIPIACKMSLPVHEAMFRDPFNAFGVSRPSCHGRSFIQRELHGS